MGENLACRGAKLNDGSSLKSFQTCPHWVKLGHGHHPNLKLLIPAEKAAATGDVSKTSTFPLLEDSLRHECCDHLLLLAPQRWLFE